MAQRQGRAAPALEAAAVAGREEGNLGEVSERKLQARHALHVGAHHVRQRTGSTPALTTPWAQAMRAISASRALTIRLKEIGGGSKAGTAAMGSRHHAACCPATPLVLERMHATAARRAGPLDHCGYSKDASGMDASVITAGNTQLAACKGWWRAMLQSARGGLCWPRQTEPPTNFAKLLAHEIRIEIRYSEEHMTGQASAPPSKQGAGWENWGAPCPGRGCAAAAAVPSLAIPARVPALIALAGVRPGVEQHPDEAALAQAALEHLGPTLGGVVEHRLHGSSCVAVVSSARPCLAGE